MGRHPLVTGVLYRKQVLDEIGLWEEDVITADIHFQMRATARYAYAISKQPYAVVVTHQTNATHQVRDGNSFLALHNRQVNLVQQTLGLGEAAHIRMTQLMDERAKRVLFKSGLAALSNADFAATRQAAKLLAQSFGDPSHARVLNTAATVAGLFGKSGLMFKGLRTARRIIRSRKHKEAIRFPEARAYIASLNQQYGL